jgi:dTDP-4-amino-4,6-dideoxygalactose transaminase
MNQSLDPSTRTTPGKAGTSPRIPILDLKRQYKNTKAEIDAAIARVVESGYFISRTGGPEVQAFEAEFAAYCGVSQCVAVGSGTAALNLTLRALGVGSGDEVVTVAFTVSATLDAIVALGAMPVLVDVDPDTYTMDAAKIEATLTDRTKAVLPVHTYGHPADMDNILSLASAKGLAVVADACEAHGALYKNAQVAALGTASCFSFYPTKNLNAFGDGGGILTNDPALSEKLRLLRQHGWDRRYHSVVSSLNSSMDEIQAAVLRAHLTHLDEWNNRRRAIAARYDAALTGTSVRPAPHAQGAGPSYFQYVLATPARDLLRQTLEHAGIATDISWPEPPHLQPAFAMLGYGGGSMPITERLCNEVLTIPIFPDMTDAEVDRVCQVLREFA